MRVAGKITTYLSYKNRVGLNGQNTYWRLEKKLLKDLNGSKIMDYLEREWLVHNVYLDVLVYIVSWGNMGRTGCRYDGMGKDDRRCFVLPKPGTTPA